jgi:outer membrane biosynthesis protein TonB
MAWRRNSNARPKPERPKRKFISASTREYAYAAYMRAWVAKIERIGNLNYPDEARRRQVHNSLVLTVAVKRDGSVERIDSSPGLRDPGSGSDPHRRTRRTVFTAARQR